MRAKKYGIAKKNIKSLDWKENEVIVAHKGDRVRILQEFSEMVFIECAHWDFEVVTSPKNIEIEEC